MPQDPVFAPNTTQRVRKTQEGVAKELLPANAGFEVLSRKLAALTERLALLEAALYVDADGSVTLCSNRGISIVSDQRVTVGAPTIQFESNGNLIKLEASGIRVSSPSRIELTASQVTVASGTFQVDTGMARFSGTVRCDTIIANSVVGSSYTPGAGNIW